MTLDQREIATILSDLDSQCPSGYALAFHVRYAAPNFLFQTYSGEWIDIYSQRGYVMVDPTVKWGFENIGLTRWSALAGDDPEGVLDAAKEFGLTYGFAFALDTNGSRSVTSFARADREFTDEEMESISSLAQRLHDLTANLDELSPETAAVLRQMSIRFTHPGAATD